MLQINSNNLLHFAEPPSGILFEFEDLITEPIIIFSSRIVSVTQKLFKRKICKLYFPTFPLKKWMQALCVFINGI